MIKLDAILIHPTRITSPDDLAPYAHVVILPESKLCSSQSYKGEWRKTGNAGHTVLIVGPEAEMLACSHSLQQGDPVVLSTCSLLFDTRVWNLIQLAKECISENPTPLVNRNRVEQDDSLLRGLVFWVANLEL